VGAVVASAVLLASLSSAGTYALFSLNDPDPVAASSAGATTGELSSGKKVEQMPVDSSKNTAPNWTAVAAAASKTVVAIRATTAAGGAQGSGVITNAEKGYILTNNHVVSGAKSVKVILQDGRSVDAKVLGADPTTDLAVLQLASVPKDLTEAKLGDSDATAVGDPVMAVGNPLGLANTVTTGIISALHRPVTTSESGSSSDAVVTNAIQIDAAINPGNSGGPLFNAKGEVIGINSSIATMSSGQESQSGSIGLGFAIPSNLATYIAGQLIASGTADHAYLGVSLAEGTAKVGDDERTGAVVASLVKGGPAAAAGLKKGDVLTAVNGEPALSPEALTAWVRSYKVGDTVELTVVRDGAEKKITVKLGAAPATQAAPAPAPEQDQPQLDPRDFGGSPWGGQGQDGQ
jgi:putative serine protease PepD